jgi:hypothetical protein
MSSTLDNCLDASHLITRAAGGRRNAHEALKQMKRAPKNPLWLRRYVAASTQVEEAELQLLRIKRELGK